MVAVSQPNDIPSDQESITRGRELFFANCERCHNMGKQEIGPALASIVDKRPLSWLLSFIESSQGMIDAGDPYAVHLNRSYGNMVMPDFQELDADARMDILAYIKAESLGDEHSEVLDSIQRNNAEIFNKDAQRYADVEKEDPDYYAQRTTMQIPNDPEVIQQGQTLFESQCVVCHQLDRRTIGPALASVTDRRPLPWLLDFLDSPRGMVRQGDEYTIFMVNNYPLIMPDFSYLSQDDKLAVLAYIRNASGAVTETAGINANAITETGESSADLGSEPPKTGDMDQIGYNDERDVIGDAERGRGLDTPAALLMGAVVLLLGILAWRIFR